MGFRPLGRFLYSLFICMHSCASIAHHVHPLFHQALPSSRALQHTTYAHAHLGKDRRETYTYVHGNHNLRCWYGFRSRPPTYELIAIASKNSSTAYTYMSARAHECFDKASMHRQVYRKFVEALRTLFPLYNLFYDWILPLPKLEWLCTSLLQVRNARQNLCLTLTHVLHIIMQMWHLIWWDRSCTSNKRK